MKNTDMFGVEMGGVERAAKRVKAERRAELKGARINGVAVLRSSVYRPDEATGDLFPWLDGKVRNQWFSLNKWLASRAPFNHGQSVGGGL